MNDVLDAYGLVFGVVIALLSAGATFFNKQKIQGVNDLLAAGNDELRKRVDDLRSERDDLKAAQAAAEAKDEAQGKLIEELRSRPDVTKLMQMMTRYHKEVMTALSSKGLSNGK